MENAVLTTFYDTRGPDANGKPGFRHASRVLTGFLAAAEKRCLIWLAHRLPRSVNSDHLTVVALVAMFLAGLSYWLARWYPPALLLVIVWLAVNWFGDSLDGTVARVRNQQRPRYGFYVDHVLDTVGIFFLVAGMALSGYMSPLVAAGILLAYYMLAIEVYLATYCLGTFRISYWNFGPTELRIVLALGNLALLFHPETRIFGSTYRLFDAGGVVAIAALSLTFVMSAIRNTRALYRAEPIPPSGSPP